MSLRRLGIAAAWAILAVNAGGATNSSTPSTPPPPSLDQAVSSAYLSGRQEDYTHLAAMLESYLATHPGDLAKREVLAFTYLDKLRDPARALPHLEKVTAALPDSGKWLQLLAQALDETGDHQRAAALFARCAGLDQGDAWVRYQLGQALAKLRRHADAASAYRAAVAIDPGSPYLRVALAWELFTLDKRQEALDAVEPVRNDPAAKSFLAMAAKPAPPSPLQRAVAVAYQSGNRADFLYATRLLEQQLRRHPADLADRKTLAFTYLQKLGDMRAALPHLQQVSDALPGDAGWLEFLAQAREATGDLPGAAAAYRRAAVLTPRDPWVCWHLGRVLNKCGSPGQAEAAFREALSRDPQNEPARVELARLLLARGHYPPARALAATVANCDPRNPDATALLGDLDRLDFRYSTARAEYQAALNAQDQFAPALQGLSALASAERMQFKTSYYVFKDTDNFRQGGVFAYFTPLDLGPLRLSAFANELFFKRTTHTITVDGVTYGLPPSPTLDRNENGLDILWRANHWLQISAGAHDFTAQRQDTKWGATTAIYISPARAWNGFVSYRANAPVNESYITALDAYTQNAVAGGLDIRPTRSLSASFTGSIADYSDHNTRRDGLASIAYPLLPRAWLTAKLEGQWLDFAHGTPNYPSPLNSTLFRPVLETAPQLTSWLKLDVHEELPYVVQDSGWGTGLTAGFHIIRGDWFDLSFFYLKYMVPDFGTNYSGSGFKVELLMKF